MKTQDSTVESKQVGRQVQARAGSSTGLGLLKPWLVAFTLPLVVVVLGLTVFNGLVRTSIQNASHPGLVYGIFVAFVLGTLLAALALRRFQKERQYVQAWQQLSGNAQRRAWVEGNAQDAHYTVYPALSAVVLRLSTAERQAKFEHEVRAVESALADRLLLPNFIAGSLVGLGLVGTFVGLLGTLDDLGAIFGSLAKTGDSGANPTAVFADMVQQLQEPMRGMGTAFVTSLYGLLGSLILGLTALSVSKQANMIVKDLYAAERMFAALDAAQGSVGVVHSGASVAQDGGGVDERRLQAWLTQVQTELVSGFEAAVLANRQSLESGAQAQQQVAQAGVLAIERHTQLLSEQAQRLQEQQRQLSETVRLLASELNGERTALHQEILKLIERNRQEAGERSDGLERVLAQAVLVTEKSSRNIDRWLQVQQEAQDGLPKTGYWRDAWQKVQQYLSKAKQEQDIGRLAQAVDKQTVVLNYLASQLANQDWMQRQGRVHESGRLKSGDSTVS